MTSGGRDEVDQGREDDNYGSKSLRRNEGCAPEHEWKGASKRKAEGVGKSRCLG